MNTGTEYGSLDYTQACAIAAAHHYHSQKSFGELRGLCAWLAASEGREHGTQHAGVFLTAFMSTVGALDLEREDLQRTFSEVAAEWWADERHQLGSASTGYGAPWSPPGWLVDEASTVSSVAVPSTGT